MAAPKMQESMANRVARKVESALRGDTTIKKEPRALVGRIAGTAAAAAASLAPEAQHQLYASQDELLKVLWDTVKSFGVDKGVQRGQLLDVEMPLEVELAKGAGLGEILSLEEGRQALDAYAVSTRLEDWAGPVAGAAELAKRFDISRSTLNHWQHSSAVIGLLKGTRNRVYPIDQFIDGRPASGIAEINAIISEPRLAWFWLSRKNPELGDRRPIDLLKRDRIKQVIEAARDHFEQP